MVKIHINWLAGVQPSTVVFAGLKFHFRTESPGDGNHEITDSLRSPARRNHPEGRQREMLIGMMTFGLLGHRGMAGWHARAFSPKFFWMKLEIIFEKVRPRNQDKSAKKTLARQNCFQAEVRQQNFKIFRAAEIWKLYMDLGALMLRKSTLQMTWTSF